MSKNSQKIARVAAIKAELARRVAERVARSPINQQQLISLFSCVGSEIAEHGHNSDFTLTDRWLKENGIDVDRMHVFLASVNISDDWALLMDGDPFRLFGASETRYSWMPLEKHELIQLIDYVDDQVQKHGCYHDHRHTKTWLSSVCYKPNEVIAALMSHGGFCDCEVVLNVEDESICP